MNKSIPTLSREQLRRDWPLLALLLGLLALGIYFYPQLPERVPSHWNVRGEVDGYSSRFFGAFGLPLMNLGIYVLMLVVPSLDPKRANYQRFAGAYNVILTAATGMDALTHAIESYTNDSYQPISDILAYRAIELIGEYLRPAVTNGKDRRARYGMMLGSMLAGIAMNPTRLGIAHALAMPLGSWDLKIPHGIANGILLPHVMEFNMVANLQRFVKVAEALGEQTQGMGMRAAAERSVTAVRQLLTDIGLTTGLGDYGLTEAKVLSVVEEAMKSGNIAANTRQAAKEDVTAICLATL